jgi:hypothetical protein
MRIRRALTASAQAISPARKQAGFCRDCGRNCFDLSRAGISHQAGGSLSRKRCNECMAQNRTGYFCSGCGCSGKALMANCGDCGHP